MEPALGETLLLLLILLDADNGLADSKLLAVCSVPAVASVMLEEHAWFESVRTCNGIGIGAGAREAAKKKGLRRLRSL